MTWRRAFYTRVTKTEDLIISRFFGRRVKDEELDNNNNNNNNNNNRIIRTNCMPCHKIQLIVFISLMYLEAF